MPKLAKNQFFIVKCDLFDEVALELSSKARKMISRSVSSIVDSKSSVKEGMAMVRKSPFQTAFVVDMSSGRVTFALSQNIEFVNAAKKKKDRPPLPPDPNAECCEECNSTGQGCFVDEQLNCICIDDISGTGLGELETQ